MSTAPSPADAHRSVVRTCTAQGIGAEVDPTATIRLRGLAFGYEATRDEPIEPSPQGAVDIHIDTSDLELGETVATGGMGWIRRALQRSLDRDVVVKTLLPGRGDPLALVREARVAGRLEHPNIVPIHGLAWSAEDGPVLVMKRIEGTVWKDRIASDPDDLVAHLHVLMDVCRAVHFAHSRRVLHRDIKPDNVMVGSHGEVYLLDWGVAHTLDDGPALRLAGTPAYMSPEQVTGGVLDERTDVYLLAATLHAILTGQSRHTGADAYEVLVAAALSEPCTYEATVNPELAAIANRGCAFDPDGRFPTARAFREALARFLERRTSVADAQRAVEGLAELRASGGGAVAHQIFGRVRFGFEQALRGWSDNEVASRGLQECLEVMARFELDTGNHLAADALVAELQHPPPALVDRVAAIRTQNEAQLRASEDLADLLRFHGEGWARSRITLLNAALTSMPLLAVGYRIRHGTEITLFQNTVFTAVCTACILFGIWVFRQHILDSRLYRWVMYGLGAIGPLLLINRALAWYAGFDFVQTLALDLAVLIALAVMLVLVHPLFLVTVALAVPAALLAMANPRWCMEIVAVAYVLNDLWLAWNLRPSASADRDVGPGVQAERDRPARARA